MVETMAEAFEVTFKQLEQKREQRMVGDRLTLLHQLTPFSSIYPLARY